MKLNYIDVFMVCEEYYRRLYWKFVGSLYIFRWGVKIYAKYSKRN